MYKMKKDILHPMLYKDKRTINLLYNDIYEGYHFYILNLGTHPTAYIEIPKGNKLFGVGYSNIDIGDTFLFTLINKCNKIILYAKETCHI